MSARHKRGLQQTLAVFIVRIGIRNYSAADAHRDVTVLHGECANRHVEHCRAIWGDEAYGACVNAARLLLEPANYLHGADFGRSRNRAAGKKTPKNRVKFAVWQKGADNR